MAVSGTGGKSGIPEGFERGVYGSEVGDVALLELPEGLPFPPEVAGLQYLGHPREVFRTVSRDLGSQEAARRLGIHRNSLQRYVITGVGAVPGRTWSELVKLFFLSGTREVAS